jgi:UDPglucose 6-dehydrogenase
MPVTRGIGRDEAPRVGVVGVGYVGLTTAVCLAARGRHTVAVDVDARRVARLAAGEAVLDEPGLAELLPATVASGCLHFTADYRDLADRDVVFVCVPTPSADDGSADLRALTAALDGLAGVLRPGATIVLKSTVPVGTTRQQSNRLRDRGIGVVSSPEFLREGRALDDFDHPDRIVVGSDSARDADAVCAAYGAGPAPVLRMSPESAELAKYASNGFLAVKLSYANSLAQLCHRTGAEVADVAACMGADPRIGAAFLRPGPGWGGSCLPKDTAALAFSARAHGVAVPEIDAARTTNDAQAGRIVAALRRHMGPDLTDTRVAVLGLAFKAATSDLRDSPALTVCRALAAEGAVLRGHDPAGAAMDRDILRSAGVVLLGDPYAAAAGAHAVLVLTEWPQFRTLDWAAVAAEAPGAVVVDTRNVCDRAGVRAAGLRYLANGSRDGF